MPSGGWRLIRFDTRLGVICLWPGLLSKLAGIIKREKVIPPPTQNKKRERRKMVGRTKGRWRHWGTLSHSSSASNVNNHSNAAMFTSEQLKCCTFTVWFIGFQEISLYSLLCFAFDQLDSRLSRFPRLKCVFGESSSVSMAGLKRLWLGHCVPQLSWMKTRDTLTEPVRSPETSLCVN